MLHLWAYGRIGEGACRRIAAGLDHLRLTHRFQGRDYRLTDVAGNVIPALLA